MFLYIKRYHYALASKLLCYFCNQLRTLDSGGVDAYFISTSLNQHTNVMQRVYATTNGERNVNLICDPFNKLSKCFSFFNGSRNVQEHKFVGSLIRILSGKVDG